MPGLLDTVARVRISWRDPCEQCLSGHLRERQSPRHIPVLAINYVARAIAAVLFALVMSFVWKPTRRTLNSVLAAGAVST